MSLVSCLCHLICDKVLPFCTNLFHLASLLKLFQLNIEVTKKKKNPFIPHSFWMFFGLANLQCIL